MSLITADDLNRHMDSPEWTDEEWAEAASLCEAKEGELAGLLNTPISPGPAITETAPVLGSGLVATTYPVFAVTALSGNPVDDTHPLPAGWEHGRGYLRQQAASAVSLPGLVMSAPLPLSLIGAAPGGWAGRVDGTGAVTLTYLPGWGDQPALRGALLTKTAAIMSNRHDKTVRVEAMDATQPPPIKEEWTDEDLRPLGTFRNLVAVK